MKERGIVSVCVKECVRLCDKVRGDSYLECDKENVCVCLREREVIFEIKKCVCA